MILLLRSQRLKPINACSLTFKEPILHGFTASIFAFYFRFPVQVQVFVEASYCVENCVTGLSNLRSQNRKTNLLSLSSLPVHATVVAVFSVKIVLVAA